MKLTTVPFCLLIMSILSVLVNCRPYEPQLFYLIDVSDDVLPLSYVPESSISKRAVKREKIVMDSLGGDYLVRKRSDLYY
ncbi:unnamed protein product [Bursaphelenchus okinawaensis]|uniref:Uncharacterized protein n=1 Tax=Bursaphelenchus okinawaensis TaxID=465554 RepID=A0A811K7D9_9BILA|nr:unnamed protein product [Bursaphelenchus okinawaensis]CAG9094850.1 unnamed protein product [Bursaphelenchus okinawaensis]